MSTPSGWNAAAHAHWVAGRQRAAIETTVAAINIKAVPFPRPLGLQLAYYASMSGDWRGAAAILDEVVKAFPDDDEVCLNLGVCLSRAGDSARAADVLGALVARNAALPVAWDALASSLQRLGRLEQAQHAGERALMLKHQAVTATPSIWRPPAGTPAAFATQAGKRNVIAFSLWGDQPRYLRGALRNALAVADVYPGWVCRFYLDASVPAAFIDTLRQLGAEVLLDAATTPPDTRTRLARRFQVANDVAVGYFLVRDCDAVIGVREALAVQQWLAAECWFHVMRDWWTHTDLMLAGMWGGVAGILPDLAALLAGYQSGVVETPNIDQWFLRDRVWPLVMPWCLVHDRCFRVPGARPFPGVTPDGSRHVGQDEFAVRRDLQQRLLAAWIERLPCLRLPAA